MATNTIGLNQVFPIYKQDGTPFNDMVLRKASYNSVVMSLGDKITGDAYYKDNSLNVTMLEYILYNGVKYMLVNHPTIVREGMAKDNSELKGMTKYSFEFYHPMCQLSNFPFSDIAISSSQERYLSENKTFSWIGKPQDFIDKLNKNLQETQWIVEKSLAFPEEKENELSDVLSFDKNTIADALKKFYDTWDVPYIIDNVDYNEPSYISGKRFKIVIGLPVTEIYASESDRQLNNPYVFKMGRGVGLKNNSRTPKNNKIITRLSGYGSENNIPYGYPQIVWTGAVDDPRLKYPLYDGIVGGRYVKLIQHPFTRNHLMPSVYSDAVNKKVNPNASGYNPNIELKDYYDALGSEYPNNINPLAPSYEIHEFEDIKPEMNDGTSNVEILGAIPLNEDLTPASAWVDDIDGDGNFIQSFFKISLPQLSFDLYACAAITQEMQINVRSGDCVGCTFPIQVDWDDYKLNFYDENGDFAPDGLQRDLSKYPKSNLGSIDVIVKKENSTFGTVMPNVYQQPKSGDEFVILGISLPVEYITRAEQKLDREMRAFMLENNVYYFDYPLKFDEHFLASNTYILSQIKPNTILRFQYAEQVLVLYVKQLTIKYGNSVLPEYDITLTDDIDVVLNQIGQIADGMVGRLSSLLSASQQSGNRNVWSELSKKLSKVSDDTAQGFVRFIRGLQVGNQFVTGLLGEGGVFRKEADGTTYLEADKMYIRIKAYFDNVEIRDFKHSAGNRIASPAGAKCCRVEYIDTNGNVTTNVVNAVKFRCYFKGSDGDDEVRNNFVVGDQAYCHVTSVDTKDDDPNSKSLNMKHYWRLVVGRNNEGTLTDNGEHWIDLSNNASETLTIKGETYIHLGYQSGSDIPSAQDDIIQLGNINDTDRMGAIIEFVTGADAPSYQIFQGINDFNLNGKNYIGLGYSTQTGRAYLNVYGDAYIGDKPDTQGNAGSYLKYNAGNRQLSIKARVEFTNPDEELDEFVQEHQRDDSYDDTAIRAMIEDVQKQIDGELDTWYYSGVPTLNNEPAKYWNTDDLKREHVGDLYYDRDTGYVYRFLYDDENEVYKWTQIHDDAISEALRIASDAKDTADNKRRVFICDEQHKTPTPPYDQGDLWVNVKYPWATGATYDNEILKCSIPKTGTQTFSISDWSIANGYTAALNEFKNTYNQFVADIKTQVDGKAETWYQATDPSSNWITNELKASHVGDLWCDTSTTGGNKTYIYYDDGQGASPRYLWKEQKVPDMVFDEIDGKADIFVSKPTKYNIDDLWIIESTLSDSDMPSGCKKGDIVISSTSRNNGYNKADWSKKDRYTDDSAFNGYINAVLNGSGSSGDAATVAAAQKAIRDALGGATVVDGGLLLTSLIAMRKYKGTGDIHNSSNYNTWAGISGVRKDTETGTGWKGYGIAAWYGGGMVDHEVSTTATDYAKSLFRFDGSGYLASGNISWNKNGIVTIANVYSNVNGENVEWSGTSLQYMNNISNSLPLTYQGGTAYFDPKISFTNLSVMGKTVATQEWVSNNYISINFFSRLFRAYNGNTLVNANDTTSTIDNIKAMFGFWTEQYISALGQNSGGGGGGGIVLAEPLQSINSAGLGTPRSANVGLVWNGSSWTYGTIGTGSGTVTIVKVGTISYSPVNGVVSLPAYPTVPTKVSDLTNDVGYTTNIGTVTQVKVGTIAYNPSSGVVSLPAYPTSLPASDVYSWAKASSKPSYTLDEVSDGSSRKLSNYLPLSGGAITGNLSISGTLGVTGATTLSSTLGVTGNTTLSGTLSVSKAVTLSNTLGVSGLLTASGGITIPSGKTLKIGDAVLSWDSTNKGIKITKGLYSETFISALGAGSGGSGGGGVGDVTWELLANNSDTRQIAASHLNVLNSYLPLYGGTMTGVLTLWGSQYNAYDTGSGALNLNNSDITGVNSILTADFSEDWKESIGFKRTNGNYDTFRAANGTFYFGVNNGTEYTALHSGNSSVSKSGETLTVKINGTSQSLTNTNTWRPLGTGASDACAGNDSRLRNSRPASDVYSWAKASTKPSYSLDEISDGSTRKLANYLPLTGGTMTGTILFNNMQSNKDAGIDCTVGTRRVIFGIGTSGNAGIWEPNKGWIMGIDTSNNVFIHGNADTATSATTASKLSTARTIWGQSFNGTANVSGNMTGVGTISASGDIGVTKSSGETNVFVSNNNGKIALQTATSRGVWDFTKSRWLIATDGTDSWLNAGNVGIGTTSPSYNLHVAGTFYASGNATVAGTFYASGNATVGGDLTVNGGDLTVNEPNSSGASAIKFQSGGTTYGNLRVKPRNGQFYFYQGTTGDGQSSVCVNAGEFYAYGQVTALSDARDKNVIGDVSLNIEQIANAPAIRFMWNDGREDKSMQAGSIAQYWHKVLPEVIREKDDRLSLSYGVAALVSSIITARKVVDHECRIAELERENKELKLKLKIA